MRISLHVQDSFTCWMMEEWEEYKGASSAEYKASSTSPKRYVCPGCSKGCGIWMVVSLWLRGEQGTLVGGGAGLPQEPLISLGMAMTGVEPAGKHLSASSNKYGNLVRSCRLQVQLGVCVYRAFGRQEGSMQSVRETLCPLSQDDFQAKSPGASSSSDEPSEGGKEFCRRGGNKECY